MLDINEPEWKLGWRCFGQDSVKSDLRSVLIAPNWAGFTIYPVGEVVGRQKECGPMTVFEDETEANFFANQFIPYGALLVVRQVKYLPSEESVLYIPNKLKSIYGAQRKESNFPIGTKFADQIFVIPMEEEK